MACTYIGQIMAVAFPFVPYGWAQCNGQLLPIAQNTILFELIGTIYGGDGLSTFALPDLRGRVPLHIGEGGGREEYGLGQSGGEETHLLSVNEMPAHRHPINAYNGAGDRPLPSGNVFSGASTDSVFTDAPVSASLDASVMGVSGGSQPHTIMQPYLALNFCIALEGLHPRHLV